MCTVAESIFDDHIGTNSSYIIDRLSGICDLEVEIDKSIEFFAKKLRLKKFVKMIDHTYACNSLTNFVQ